MRIDNYLVEEQEYLLGILSEQISSLVETDELIAKWKRSGKNLAYVEDVYLKPTCDGYSPDDFLPYFEENLPTKDFLDELSKLIERVSGMKVEDISLQVYEHVPYGLDPEDEDYVEPDEDDYDDGFYVNCDITYTLK